MMNDMLSQEEINALLSGTEADNDDSSSEQGSEEEIIEMFDDIEKDALGEIGNISMGSAATTLFTLLGHRVEITTPKVEQTTINNVVGSYMLPFISVYIKYSLGIEGVNLLILKEEDVKVITSLMLGGDGITDLPVELTDMHLSAISEAMNQMMGAASTALSEMIGKKIDITPPEVSKVSVEDKKVNSSIIDPDQQVMCTSFRMKVGDLIDSEIMQILPIDFAKNLVSKMINGDLPDETDEIKEVQEEIKMQSKANESEELPFEEIPEELLGFDEDMSTKGQMEQMPQQIQQPQMQQQYQQAPPMPQQMQQMPPYSQTPYPYQAPPMPQNQVKVQPAQFSSFDANMQKEVPLPENIDLVKDVMLQITVELGKTVKPIDEILDFKPGSILELDKVVGESLDILANGKKIAMGEVVVIDENYGIRITDIVKPEKRLQTL